METNHIIAIVVALVLFIIIIKFAKSVVKFILIFLLVIGLGIYAFLHFNKISNINDLHNKYCNNLSDKKDSLKCVCIVKPIEEDFSIRFSKEEAENMNTLKFTKELSVSFIKKSKEIKTKLKENNALDLFEEFKQDILK
jgi:energy-coupling factor transporter transmembrane protein EcfT